MRHTGTIALAAAASAVACPVHADVVMTEVVIRDFMMSHIDFENGNTIDQGFVGNMLGADGKPVYVGGDGTPTTHGEKYFNQWYNDVDGVNLSTVIELPFDNGQAEPGGVYTFSDGQFFPINDQLFGNEGLHFNFHFTLEMHTQFVYVPGLEFSFTGDDDLFVFIDGQLAIDLGGVHPAMSASVDWGDFDLVPGNLYSLDLFFAERHTTQSTFRVDTSIQFLPPDDGACCLPDGGCVLMNDDDCAIICGNHDGVGSSCAAAPCAGGCPGDMNQDGIVDVLDLIEAILAWGNCNADVDGDGVSTAADLQLIVTAWGDCSKR